MNKFLKSAALISLLFTTQVSAVTGTLDSRDEGGNSSFSVELLESSCAKIGVVMYHGRGKTPVKDPVLEELKGPVVDELRNTLFRAGYTTLSIENPLPASGFPYFADYITDVDAVFIETFARMRTAINFLQSRGVEQVVLAGFSLGSRFAAAHVALGQLDELEIIGLIGIGMYDNGAGPLRVTLTLDKVAIPVLDIYGDADTKAFSSAPARLSAYAGSNYTQIEMKCLAAPNNCHQLQGLKGNDSMDLEVAVNAWMQATAPASVLPNCGTQSPPAVTPPQTIPDAAGSALDIYLLLALPAFLSVFRLRCNQNI